MSAELPTPASGPVGSLPEIPNEVNRLFLDPPLLHDEAELDYLELVRVFARILEPQDIIEWVLVRDLADATWAEQRWRRIGASAVSAALLEGLKDELVAFLPEPTPEQLPGRDKLDPQTRQELWAKQATWGWFARQAELSEIINNILKQGRVDLKVVSARGITKNIDALTRLNGLVAAEHARKLSVLRELDGRRAASRPRAEAEETSLGSAAAA